ncbi:MAG: hypothetical protein U0U67_14280 [Chitinophagales bacterium]
MIESYTKSYIESYLADNYDESAHFYFKIIDCFSELQSTQIREAFLLYFNTLIASKQYTDKVIGTEIDRDSLNHKLQIYLEKIDMNANTMIDSLTGGSESFIIALNNYSVDELLQLQHNPKKNKVDSFKIVLNKHASKTIYFLYDANENYFYDLYLGKNLTINGNSYNAYDYHLPIYKLVQKYFPDHAIILTNDRNETGDQKYVYVQTFSHFFNFMKEKKAYYFNTIPESVRTDFSTNKVILIFNFLQEAHINSYHFADLLNGLKKINASYLKNIFFLSGNMDDSNKWNDFVENKLVLYKNPTVSVKNLSSSLLHNSRNKKAIQFYSFRYFEEATCAQAAFFKQYMFEQKMELLKNTNNFKYFLCLNRMVKDYRIALSYFFYANNLLDKTVLSQNTIPDSFTINDNSFFRNISADKFIAFKSLLPFSIDTTIFKANLWNIIPYQSINQSFLWIVSESVFLNGTESKRINFKTEKTYKPILFFMPFVIVGNHHVLKDLRNEGYKTFSDFWDESYDDEANPEKRMNKIFKLILELSKLSKLQILELYQKMQPVLEHNYNKLMQTNAAKESIAKIIERYAE